LNNNVVHLNFDENYTFKKVVKNDIRYDDKEVTDLELTEDYVYFPNIETNITGFNFLIFNRNKNDYYYIFSVQVTVSSSHSFKTEGIINLVKLAKNNYERLLEKNIKINNGVKVKNISVRSNNKDEDEYMVPIIHIFLVPRSVYGGFRPDDSAVTDANNNNIQLVKMYYDLYT
jgi:hypothetical protein